MEAAPHLAAATVTAIAILPPLLHRHRHRHPLPRQIQTRIQTHLRPVDHQGLAAARRVRARRERLLGHGPLCEDGVEVVQLDQEVGIGRGRPQRQAKARPEPHDIPVENILFCCVYHLVYLFSYIVTYSFVCDQPPTPIFNNGTHFDRLASALHWQCPGRRRSVQRALSHPDLSAIPCEGRATRPDRTDVGSLSWTAASTSRFRARWAY